MDNQKSQLSDWQSYNEDDRSPTVDLRAPESIPGLHVDFILPASSNASDIAGIKELYRKFEDLDTSDGHQLLTLVTQVNESGSLREILKRLHGL